MCISIKVNRFSHFLKVIISCKFKIFENSPKEGTFGNPPESYTKQNSPAEEAYKLENKASISVDDELSSDIKRVN